MSIFNTHFYIVNLKNPWFIFCNIVMFCYRPPLPCFMNVFVWFLLPFNRKNITFSATEHNVYFCGWSLSLSLFLSSLSEYSANFPMCCEAVVVGRAWCVNETGKMEIISECCMQNGRCIHGTILKAMMVRSENVVNERFFLFDVNC